MSDLTTEQRHHLPDSEFAFPKERKEPIENASHVRDALARFDQVEGVTNQERDEAFKRIQKAAQKFGVHMNESSWQELYKRNGRPIPKD